MTNPILHTTMVKAASLEQELRNRDVARADDSRALPMRMTRRRATSAGVRRLRLPSIPLPRRLTHASSR